MDRPQFVAEIVANGGDERAAGFVWDALAAEWTVEDFTPYPTDSLGRVFGIAEEELDEDLIVRILSEQGLPLPPAEVIQRFGEIDSPERVAQFVRVCREVADRSHQEGAGLRFDPTQTRA
jgi:hypothetical protein